MELLDPTDHGSHCPYKGDARYWTVIVGEKRAENAAWSYDAPIAAAADITEYVAFYWRLMDHWYEEDEEIFVHPRDPYKRIDVVESRRSVRVVLGGETVAETEYARFLFETGLPTRYYIPRQDVRMDRVVPSDSRTRCPYKGVAVYWSAHVGDRTWEDIVWSYPEPIAECPRIRGHLCFFNEHVDAIFVDDRPVPKVETPWSKRDPD